MTDIPRPNLFVLGAAKIGTSSLHSWISEHPDIFMCRPKEPCYFVEKEQLLQLWPDMYEQGFWRREEVYLELFKDAGSAQIIGESSTNYTRLNRVKGCPERIKAFNPDARFIYVMRDPVERAISHYWHRVRYERETKPPLRALREYPDYLEMGAYEMQLAPYFELFGRDRLLLHTFERMCTEPEAALRETFEWLGVDSSFVPPNLHERENVTPRSFEIPRGAGILQGIRHSELWQGLGPKAPEVLRRLGRFLAERRLYRKDASVAEAYEYAREQLCEPTERLAATLERAFTEWSTMFSA